MELKKIKDKGTCFPDGFLSAGINCGIKEGALDLGILICERECITSATFTTNRVKAAPVKVSIESLNRNFIKRGVIVNSGNANCATGKRGIEDAIKMIRETSRVFSIPEDQILVCSTGVIGVPLPIERITQGIQILKEKLNRDDEDFSKAIMTTDRFPKRVAINCNGKFKIGGSAKGAGMIHPKMATMLAFITTDVEIEKEELDRMLREAVDLSFNRISVDGDTSTNDTVIIFSRKGKKLDKAYYGLFKEALIEVCTELAKMMVRDGEGSTKVVKLNVKKALNKDDAEKIARSVANSLLVKTALFGEDPNWGRIIAAIGYSGAHIEENLVDIYIGDVKVTERGISTGMENKAKEIMKNGYFEITIEINLGSEEFFMYMNDLTYDYVRINADYRS
ncbi:MAG: bifunctional glutamate N-acetyltransferase/amino-acid acetyltransferase ArgJ [Thermosulfidibacteraceae bacterium]